MNSKQKINPSLLLPVMLVFLSMLACQASDLLSTPTPYPTYTPYPEIIVTPYPTYTPYPQPSLTPAPDVRYTEDFEGSSSCFEPYSDAVMNSQMSDGAYSVRITESNQGFLSICPGQTFIDFTLEADIRLLEDTAGSAYFGVMFRETGGQYYSFILSTAPDGYPIYCVSYIGSNSYTPLTNSTFDPGNCWSMVPAGVYDAQTNRLRVSMEGEVMSIYLNDEILTVVRDNLLSAGRVGLLAGTYDQPVLEAAYDNLRVTVP